MHLLAGAEDASATATVTGILPADEAAELAACEQVIEQGLATFVQVGEALLTIRDGKLYRASHETFAGYCRERWGFGRAHAYRMIEAAEAVSPIGDTGLPLPANEAQARELARVPETERAQAWREALEQTGGKPTAAAVRQAVAVIAAARAHLAEEKAREQAERERDTGERLERDRERLERDCEVDGWLHKEVPILLGARLDAIADEVRRCRPSIGHGYAGLHSDTAHGFGFINWRAMEELAGAWPVPELEQAMTDLKAALAAYNSELGAAVRRAGAAVARIEARLRAAAARSADEVIGTEHHYRRPMDLGPGHGWLYHYTTAWADPPPPGDDSGGGDST